MTALTNWFIRNPVAANLLMVFLLVVGVTSLMTMRIEGFPKIPADTVVVTTTLPNAYTEQVDQQITRKIEKAIEGLQGVKNIRSVSEPGFSRISIQKVNGYKLQELLDDVRLKVDGIYDLPKDARRPIIETNNFDVPALYVSIHGETDLKTLQSLARSLRLRLLAGEEISRVNDWGLQGQEIAVELKPGTLERLDLTISEVMTKIQESSLYFQGGTLRREGGYISLRADSQAYTVEDYRQIPLIEWADGSTTYLGDVATITDGFEEVDFQTRFNGLQSVGMEVLIGRKDNLLNVSAEANEIIEDFNRTLPEGVTAEIWGDSSTYISDRLRLLSSSAVQGLFLVALLLAIFLNVKLAFWVAMGIPISMAGALAVSTTGWIDYSLNDITTFGFIIVLGILVDDAVVVGESVHEQRRRFADPIKGTEIGVERVSIATVFGVLTTVAAFAPMLLIDNPLGKVLASFAGVVILALLFSLLESKLILPAHLAHISIHGEAKKSLPARLWGRVQRFFRSGLFGFRDKIYAPVLKVALANRYAVLVLFFAVATFVFGLMATGQIKSTFFPNVPGQIVSVSMEMDSRAPVQLTRKNVEIIEQAALELNEEFAQRVPQNKQPIEHLFTYMSGAANASLYMELIPSEQRPDLTTRDIMEAWEQRVGQLEGISEISFSGFEEFSGGFEIRLLGENAELLRAASAEVRDKLASFKGVSNVRDTFNSGQPELRLRLKPEARHLGFSSERLASQIGYAFGGGEAQRIQRGTSEVRVVVRSVLEARNTIEDLLQLRLKSADGTWIPLQAVADVEARYVNNEITRRNSSQVSLISADVNREVVPPEELGQALFGAFAEEIEAKYPGVELKQSGELEDIGEMKGGLLRAFIIAGLLIYILIAVPLKSYWKPLLIMSVVPFGFVGAVIGHGIMDLPFSLLSFFGVLALIGVVVNDSLVMMTFYLQSREEGMSHKDATFRCGVDRFQAIFLTTATTVVGLIPLMSETSEQARYLIPAAVSLAYGEIFATLITLILIPVLLSIGEDIRRLIWGKTKEPSFPAVEPGTLETPSSVPHAQHERADPIDA
ncbi:efflux RND transporter permease subunit [Pseudovibrio sp. SPO723]|uniref:efflux RND transporter permease subunit n=1 Tax=Nesiotobacter zosterae TaxID=392721 RepID=UPI0029C35C9B|nr:efflux RND transporter permease subunit [Pseudovibrio sp. SPO723]MDX5593464.1 efflux RND transporter permease subunit [Pseudovibrio sp. SPO723]